MRYRLAAMASLCFCTVSSAATSGEAPLPTSSTAKVEQQYLLVRARSYMSLNANTARHFERVVVRRAEKEPWWMLFVGTTLIGYRLFRNHQLLFAGSLLATEHEFVLTAPEPGVPKVFTGHSEPALEV